MRPLQWNLKLNWKYPESMEKLIPCGERRILKWWARRENLIVSSPLHPLEPQVEVATDASNEGWGAHLINRWDSREKPRKTSCQLPETAQGQWSGSERQEHINCLELRAVHLALKYFRQRVEGKVVLVSTDNATVLSHINKQGGTHSLAMFMLTWDLLQWCRKHQVTLRAKGGKA